METRLIKTKNFHQKILRTRKLDFFQPCRLSPQNSRFFRSKFENCFGNNYFSQNFMHPLKKILRTGDHLFHKPVEEQSFKGLIVFGENTKTFLETRLTKTKSFHQKILWTRRIEILQQCWLSFQKYNFFWSKSENKFKEDYFSRKFMWSFKSFLRTR